MKRQFLIASLLFIFSFTFFLFHPKNILAASCSSQGGHCIYTGTCAYDAEALPADDCSSILGIVDQKCCPAYEEANKCENKGGYCTLVKCSHADLGGGCLTGLNCCSNTGFNSTSINCEGENTINTAIGCVDVSSPESLFSRIFGVITGLGGGIALALMLYGVFIVTTSAGIPDKLNAGKEIITSAIIGLIFVLISIFLVRLIGVDILGIPGLTR